MPRHVPLIVLCLLAFALARCTFVAAPAFAASADEGAKLREEITAKDRQIADLRASNERLTYAAGLRDARPGAAALPANVAKRQHAETLEAVATQNETLAGIAESNRGIRAILAANNAADKIRSKAVAERQAADTLSHELLVVVACLVVAGLGLQVLFMLGIWRQRGR